MICLPIFHGYWGMIILLLDGTSRSFRICLGRKNICGEKMRETKERKKKRGKVEGKKTNKRYEHLLKPFQCIFPQIF